VMQRHVTPQEARAALETVERGRLQVIDEIDLPRWYWSGLALGWIGLGFVADLGYGWITAAAMFAFGTIHAAVAGRVLSGRRRSKQLSVSAEVAGRQAPRLVFGGLFALTALTIAGALAAGADGAGHPTTVASIVVAVMIVPGGPQVLAVVRRKAARAGRPA
jgi:hypothetical protein